MTNDKIDAAIETALSALRDNGTREHNYCPDEFRAVFRAGMEAAAKICYSRADQYEQEKAVSYWEAAAIAVMSAGNRIRAAANDRPEPEANK